MARSQMRRARTEALMNSGLDPVTGMPRTAADPAAGRPGAPVPDLGDRQRQSSLEEDGGLILVPGTGERPRTSGGAAVEGNAATRSSGRGREDLPGTRVPAVGTTIPSVAPRLTDRPPNGFSGVDPSSRASGVRPGIISGGMGATTPGARSGEGTAASAGELNAGRLPAGLPQTRGMAPGMSNGPRAGSMQPAGSGRLSGSVPGVPRPGVGPYRGPPMPGNPSVGRPTASRPGMPQPDGGRSTSRTPPRQASPTVGPTQRMTVPRMTTDDLYGR